METKSIKIVILGNGSVGKTSLLLRYADNKFILDAFPTTGIDHRIINITIEGQKVQLKIWDTAGQEQFRSITNSYIKGAQGAFVVFAVDLMDSFNSVQEWIKLIKEKDPSIDIVLLGNKIDLPRTVSKEAAEELAKNNDMRYFEVSAKDGTDVTEAFECLSTVVYRRINNNNGGEVDAKANSVDLTKTDTNKDDDKKSCGC